MRIISRLLLAQCLSVLSYAANTNRTIDDTNGDSVTGTVPTYSPSSVWVPCLFPWTMSFTGIAIYVYFILANNEGDGITTTSKANFSIDRSQQGTFTHTPASSTDLQYNALVFTQTGLSNTTHSLLISTEGTDDIYVNFDYAIYTHDDHDSCYYDFFY
ncbi:hypothetical protein C8R44DRAFT_310507 [Mycena epipterygia]|nr:hypothetical protein C8R44DRAFT_310507 [Mycena epipterygia]